LVFLATANDAKQQQFVLAYDRLTGDKRWQTLIHEGGFPSTKQLHKKGTNANSTVACDGERAYIAFLNSEKIFVTAIDLQGKIAWQRDIGAFDSKFGYAPSPVLYKSLVIVAADNWGGGYIAALDGKSGKIAWRIARPDNSTYSSPGIANVGGRDQLLISGNNQVASYNPTTGQEIWSTPCGSEATCGTVVGASDRVFASGGYPERETVCLSGDGEILWKNNTKVYEPSMLVAGDHLFAVSDDGIAYCWSVADGELRWRTRLGGSFSASPIHWDGLVYVSNLSGQTFVFKATGEGYEEVAINKLGDDCYASPAVVDEELFLRIGNGPGSARQEQLVCIGKPKETAEKR
jgi:outer membrane protein assembly factor BamB